MTLLFDRCPQLVAKWPLTQALHRVGLNPDVIGKIVCDRSLGLTSEADLLHLEYADIVKVWRAKRLKHVCGSIRVHCVRPCLCEGRCHCGPRAQGP